MAPLLVWTGPIDSSQLAKVDWPCQVDKLVIGMGIGSSYDCSGSMVGWSVEQHVDCHGSSAFRRLADRYGSAKALVEARGASWSTPRALASFSAGHGLVEPLALQGWDWIHLADSYYTGTPSVKPNIGAYARAAADGQGTLTATASGFASKGTNSCAECIQALVEYAGLRLDDALLASWPWPERPMRVFARGRCLVADYGTRLTHGQHATVLAPQAFRTWIAPALCAGAAPPWLPKTSAPRGWVALGIGAALAAATAAVLAARRISR